MPTKEDILRQCEIVIFRRQNELERDLRYHDLLDTTLLNELGVQMHNLRGIRMAREYQEMTDLRAQVKSLRKTGELLPD